MNHWNQSIINQSIIDEPLECIIPVTFYWNWWCLNFRQPQHQEIPTAQHERINNGFGRKLQPRTWHSTAGKSSSALRRGEGWVLEKKERTESDAVISRAAVSAIEESKALRPRPQFMVRCISGRLPTCTRSENMPQRLPTCTRSENMPQAASLLNAFHSPFPPEFLTLSLPQPLPLWSSCRLAEQNIASTIDDVKGKRFSNALVGAVERSI